MMNVNNTATPAELGYFMPAEWARHDAIWLSWPHDPETFPDRVDRAEETYIKIISAIHASERVELFVLDEDMREKVSARLRAAGVAPERVNFHVHEYADVWFRDYGPIFLLNRSTGALAMTHWIFNAWGGKYETLMPDTRIPEIINRDMELPRFEPGIVLEGGSIDVNGQGTLLTTEQCLLNKNRNPHLTRADIEGYLRDYLAAEKVIWLGEGIAGDDTDGHIDDIARFVAPDTVMCAVEEDPADENYALLRENADRLRAETIHGGRPMRVIELPMPARVEAPGGRRLPASYANFYIGNTTVLVPTFRCDADERALETVRSQFREKKVVGIDCVDLVLGLGTLHCISQQQPAEWK